MSRNRFIVDRPLSKLLHGTLYVTFSLLKRGIWNCITIAVPSAPPQHLNLYPNDLGRIPGGDAEKEENSKANKTTAFTITARHTKHHPQVKLIISGSHTKVHELVATAAPVKCCVTPTVTANGTPTAPNYLQVTEVNKCSANHHHHISVSDEYCYFSSKTSLPLRYPRPLRSTY